MTSEYKCAFHVPSSPPPFTSPSQLFEAHMRCAITEAETREEVMEDMEERMRNMERMYLKRITDEVKMNERKTDAKIDMLHRTGLLESGGSAEEEEEFVSCVLTPVMTVFAHRARRVRKRIMPLITCLRTTSTSMRNGLLPPWNASPPWIDPKNYLQVRSKPSGNPPKMTWTCQWT